MKESRHAIARKKEGRPEYRGTTRAIIDGIPRGISLVNEPLFKLGQPRRIPVVETLIVVHEVKIVIEIE